MDFEWDEAKAAVNLRKHRVEFCRCGRRVRRSHALSMPDSTTDEQRFVATGSDFLGRVLVVIYAYRGERVRIISARRATPNERKTYQEGAP